MTSYIKVPIITKCVRCGDKHENLVFTSLSQPGNDPDDWTHWAACPTNGEPILLKRIATAPLT